MTNAQYQAERKRISEKYNKRIADLFRQHRIVPANVIKNLQRQMQMELNRVGTKGGAQRQAIRT